MRFSIFSLSLFVFISASAASASERMVGTAAVNIVAPAGQCEMTGATPQEVEALKKMRDLADRGSVHLIALYGNCDQVESFRRNSLPDGLQDFAQYVVQNQLLNRILPERALSDVCAASKKLTTTKLEEITKSVQSLAKRSGIPINMDKVHFLGVIAEETSGACYTGSVIQPSNGRLKLTVATNVLVNGKFITYQITAPYRGRHSVDELLEQHKANVAAFRAANMR